MTRNEDRNITGISLLPQKISAQTAHYMPSTKFFNLTEHDKLRKNEQIEQFVSAKPKRSVKPEQYQKFGCGLYTIGKILWE